MDIRSRSRYCIRGNLYFFIPDFDSRSVLEIFTSEDVELPRSAVADYLEKIDSSICARYLVFLIEERNEVSPLFHDRLAELYLSMTLSAKKRADESAFVLPVSVHLLAELICQNYGRAHTRSFCNSSIRHIIMVSIVYMGS